MIHVLPDGACRMEEVMAYGQRLEAILMNSQGIMMIMMKVCIFVMYSVMNIIFGILQQVTYRTNTEVYPELVEEDFTGQLPAMVIPRHTILSLMNMTMYIRQTTLIRHTDSQFAA